MDADSSCNYPAKCVMVDILSRSPLPNDDKITVFSMLSYLSEDLVTEILLRLAVNSLVRFKSTCREWQRIITSPSFIKRHFHHRGSSFMGNIVHWCGGDRNPEGKSMLRPWIEPYDEVNLCSIFLDGMLAGYKVPHRSGVLDAMRGPCNGIFCVIRYLDGGHRTIGLWNPATRWFRPLPSCPYFDLDCFDIDFGVDPETDDYKIVLFYLVCGQRQFSIYNSRNDSWKLFEEDLLFDSDYRISRNGNGRTFLNGVFYRMKIQVFTRKTSLLSFDMGTDSFQEIDMPQILEFVGSDATLDVFDDTLALIKHSVGGNYTIDIWLMKEQWCWTKHKTVSLPIGREGPIGIWKRNQIYACKSFVR